MWIVIVPVFVGLISALIVWLIRRHDRRSLRPARNSRAPLEQHSMSAMVVQRGSIDWKEMHQHMRFDELLSLEGSTLAGEAFQLIISLAAKSQADILYARVGPIVQRVAAGQTGLAHIRKGEDARIRQNGGMTDISTLVGTTKPPEELVGESGFSLVVSFVNSLTEGSSFRYAVRCSGLKHRFIKRWDIPSAQSDEALLARVSSVADVAVLAEKVRDIQTAESFLKRHRGTLPLESGVCYILGEGGGRDLKFAAVSEVALLTWSGGFDRSIKRIDLVDIADDDHQHRNTRRLSGSTSPLDQPQVLPAATGESVDQRRGNRQFIWVSDTSQGGSNITAICCV